MSHVTNVMVNVFGAEPDENIDALEAPFTESGSSSKIDQSLCRITRREGEAWGGIKAPEVDLWAAAFNYVSTERIIERIQSIPWRYPQDVQLFVCHQEESRFTVYEFRSGAFSDATAFVQVL